MKNSPEVSSSNPAHFQITDEAEACAAILTACLRANELDGMPENAVFHTTIRSRNIFQGYDPDTLLTSVGKYFERAGSPKALIDASVGAIREQTRLPLFYHCLDVILSDGLVTPTEHKVFQYLKARLKVEDEDAFRAMDVLVVKNQL
ncbi:MAG: hypothetical protein JNL02_11070 [Saprospiraceae bacterium]|nr:hypothetical protein [Saprospiraceae bacterium]